MGTWEYRRSFLSAVGVVAFLSACGGSQSPIGAPGGVPSNPAAQNRVSTCGAGGAGRVSCHFLVERGAPSPVTVGGWGPADIQAAYDLPSTTKGQGQIVAVVTAYDNPNVASDLATYRSQFGLPAASFYKYNENGEQGDYPQGNKTWGVATDSTVEMVSAACPNCTIDLFEANSDLGSDAQKAVKAAEKLGAHIIDNVWSCVGITCVDASYFKKKGVTYLGAGRDWSFSSVYPADLDSVVAVGATALSKGGGGKRGWTESIWYLSLGGCVSNDPKPAWQHDTVCADRATDDVSIVGSEVAAYDSYGGYGPWFEISGTLISEGLASGVFALAGNATKQDGGRTFWKSSHHKDLYDVCGTSCLFGRYSYGGGWGSPKGITAF
jgi:hypothetical protein